MENACSSGGGKLDSAERGRGFLAYAKRWIVRSVGGGWRSRGRNGGPRSHFTETQRKPKKESLPPSCLPPHLRASSGAGGKDDRAAAFAWRFLPRRHGDTEEGEKKESLPPSCLPPHLCASSEAGGEDCRAEAFAWKFLPRRHGDTEEGENEVRLLPSCLPPYLCASSGAGGWSGARRGLEMEEWAFDTGAEWGFR
jgi:hypothetical protein